MRNYSRNRRTLGAASVEFAFIASGKTHGYNYRNEKLWDYEPGIFLCEMAGAKIKSIPGFHAAAMNQKFLDLLEQETTLN